MSHTLSQITSELSCFVNHTQQWKTRSNHVWVTGPGAPSPHFPSLLRGTETPWNDLKWPKIGNSVTFRSLSATVLQGLHTVHQSHKCLAAFSHHFVTPFFIFACSWQYHLVWINLYVSCILILIVSFGSELQNFFPGPQAPPVHQCHSTITDEECQIRWTLHHLHLWSCIPGWI